MSYAHSPKRVGLPREVLKWLQSLDLSVSPKNMRRDFSNGYLVAEILSWYYPVDISMHSYHNGMSLETKQSNWVQINKVLMKHRLSLLKEAVDGTVHCKPGAAEALIQEIYSLLTHRRIQIIQEGALDFSDWRYQEQLPMVARSTASRAIQSNLRLSEDLAEHNVITKQLKIHNIIHQHVEHRKEERSLEPDRFSVKATLEEQALRLNTLTTQTHLTNTTRHTAHAVLRGMRASSDCGEIRQWSVNTPAWLS